MDSRKRFVVTAVDLDDSVRIFDVFLSAELAEQSLAGLSKQHWRFRDWRWKEWQIGDQPNGGDAPPVR
jgi:hypothetical protein